VVVYISAPPTGLPARISGNTVRTWVRMVRPVFTFSEPSFVKSPVPPKSLPYPRTVPFGGRVRQKPSLIASFKPVSPCALREVHGARPRSFLGPSAHPLGQKKSSTYGEFTGHGTLLLRPPSGPRVRVCAPISHLAKSPMVPVSRILPGAPAGFLFPPVSGASWRWARSGPSPPFLLFPGRLGPPRAEPAPVAAAGVGSPKQTGPRTVSEVPATRDSPFPHHRNACPARLISKTSRRGSAHPWEQPGPLTR